MASKDRLRWVRCSYRDENKEGITFVDGFRLSATALRLSLPPRPPKTWWSRPGQAKQMSEY